MKVAKEVVEARRRELAHLIKQKRFIPVQEVCERFNVSEATVRRDLRALESDNQIVRTYGGAMGDFDRTFASFQERLEQRAAAKQRIATKAVTRIASGMTCFLDAGTSIWYIAKELLESKIEALTVVTNNLAIADLIGSSNNIRVVVIGGEFLNRQSVLLGEVAIDSIQNFKFDIAFFGAEGMDDTGVYNNQKDVVTLQKAVLKQAHRSIFCLDSSKAGRTGGGLVAKWSKAGQLLTDCSATGLESLGLKLPKEVVIQD